MDLIDYFTILAVICHISKVELVVINDKQNAGCHVSNFCEKTLSLQCQDRDDKANPLQLSNGNNNQNMAWNAVCGSLEGNTGKEVVLVVKGNKGKQFQVREICLDVSNGIRVDWSYDIVSSVVPMQDTTAASDEVCIKVTDEEHVMVKSVKVTVVPQQGKKVRVSLRFTACGDQTGLGSINTFPNANNTGTMVQHSAKGHEECFDQYTLNYGNRQAGIIAFNDGLSGRSEDNALQGSGRIYTGAEGQSVKFTFTVKLSDHKPKFVWWRVCFLIRHVSKMTFTMLGETETWTQSIEVCQSDNYLWKCYTPWNHFDEITKGEVELEAGDSQEAISVQEMSITVCLDNEFAGDIVRIGRKTIKCHPEKANKTDICDTVRIQHKDLTEFTSPFDLSDNLNRKNTTTAWKILAGSKEPVITGRGTKQVYYFYTLRKHCPLLSDGRFQARSIQFWGQHIERVIVKFCDSNHPLKDKNVYCHTDKRGFIKWNDPSTGAVVVNKPKNPAVAQKFIINNWFVSTGVRLLLVAATPTINPMRIWNFNIYACCDPVHAKRDCLDNTCSTVTAVELCTVRPPPPAKDQTAARVTGDACTHSFQLLHKSKKNKPGSGLFSFTDRDDNKDETLALEGSDQEYIGEPGRNVYFYIAFKDGLNFEFWKVCGRYLNIQRITYIMETSRVTFIESKSFCGFNVWQRTCYYPRNEGIIVKKAAVKFEVVPGREAHIKSLDVEACRDHFSYNYSLHIHPCDFKSLVIETPRNQKISIHALKDRAGKWLQTELYHFTDRTGNDGDNTWFMLEPEHHLVSAIWTKQTHMSLKWDVVNNKVVFQIYISAGNQIHTSITLLNLKDLYKLTVKNFTKESPNLDTTSIRHCCLLPFTLFQCEKKTKSLVLTADVKASDTFTVPGHFTHQTDQHHFILPKAKFGSKSPNQVRGICSSVTEVMEAECERHAIFNRIQHQFICDSVKSVMSKYDTVTKLDISHMYQACLLTYKTLRWTCAVMADRPIGSLPFFFTTACLLNRNFEVEELDDKLGSATTEIRVKAADTHNQKLTSPVIKIQNLNKTRCAPGINLKSKRFVITGITTIPEEIPEVHSYNYTVCINYECPNGHKNEQLHLMPRGAPDATTKVTVCKRLMKRKCCVTMHRRLRKKITHSVMIFYFPDGKKKTLQQEELIPTF